MMAQTNSKVSRVVYLPETKIGLYRIVLKFVLIRFDLFPQKYFNGHKNHLFYWRIWLPLLQSYSCFGWIWMFESNRTERTIEGVKNNKDIIPDLYVTKCKFSEWTLRMGFWSFVMFMNGIGTMNNERRQRIAEQKGKTIRNTQSAKCFLFFLNTSKY